MNGYHGEAASLKNLIDRDPNCWIWGFVNRQAQDSGSPLNDPEAFDRQLNLSIPNARILHQELETRARMIDQARTILGSTNLRRYLPDDTGTNPLNRKSDRSYAILKNIPIEKYTPELRKRIRRLLGCKIQGHFRGPGNTICEFGKNPKATANRVNIYIRFDKNPNCTVRKNQHQKADE